MRSRDSATSPTQPPVERSFPVKPRLRALPRIHRNRLAVAHASIAALTDLNRIAATSGIRLRFNVMPLCSNEKLPPRRDDCRGLKDLERRKTGMSHFDWNDRTRYWVIYSIVCGVSVIATAVQRVEPNFAGLAFLYLLLMFAVTVIGLVPVTSGSTAVLNRLQAITVVMASAAINLGCFTFLHLSAGIRIATGSIDTTAILDGLYFSIVTFTTLGYGDLQPAPDGRIYAALQALTGYMHLGLIIGLGVNGFTPSTRRNGIHDKRR